MKEAIILQASISRPVPRLGPRLCLTSYSPPSCVLEDTDMLETKTVGMFCLHDTLKKQTARDMITGTEKRTAEPASSCGKMLKGVSFQVGGKG